MFRNSHLLVTRKAFDILYSIDDSPPTLEFRRKVEFHAWNTDNYRDLEFVDVEGSVVSTL